RRKSGRAVGAAHAARGAKSDRRSFVVWLRGQAPRRRGVGVFLPGAFELRAIALGAIAAEKFLVALDTRFDEILGGFLEDRASFFGVGLQQRVAAPAFDLCGDLPAEIDHVVEAVVEAVGTVRRMRVGGVAGDKNAADLIFLGNRDAQIP